MAVRNFRTNLAVLCTLVASSAHAQIPDFISRYYSEALELDGFPLVFTSQSEKDGIKRAVFEKLGGSVSVIIDHISCDRPQCTALLEQNLKRHNEHVALNSGSFRSISQSEYVAAWNEDSKSILLYFAKLPAAVQVWIRVTNVANQLAEEPYLSSTRRVINRRRFEDAKQLGNVDTGLWSREVAQHARDLKASGKADDALGVLTQLITWAPANFEAHLDFAEHTKNEAAARASAAAVWANAEDEKLIARAARLLGRSEPRFETLPVVERGLNGLLVVLIPLPPFDLRLVEEAANLFTSSINVPVKIARLPFDWTWQTPQRVFREREVRGTIIRKTGGTFDFTGWTKDRYAKELASATAKDDPLARYWIVDFLKSFADKPGQYRVDPYLATLASSLKPIRGDDRRTMFVGVTGADIFGGDSNFVFSGTTAVNGQAISILSYARMLASSTGEPFESRRRVVQRLAKEMVPPTLKQLEIPRPADPTDPYSYSDGVQRLDQKMLTLSAPTREALDRIRNP